MNSNIQNILSRKKEVESLFEMLSEYVYMNEEYNSIDRETKNLLKNALIFTEGCLNTLDYLNNTQDSINDIIDNDKCKVNETVDLEELQRYIESLLAEENLADKIYIIGLTEKSVTYKFFNDQEDVQMALTIEDFIENINTGEFEWLKHTSIQEAEYK